MDDKEKLSRKERFELAVQTGLQLIPTIGGPLATAYFGNKQEKRFKRIESFYEEFAQFSREVEYRFASIHSHNPDELFSIVEELNEKIEKEHTEEKRTFFKNYLKNTLISPVNGNFDKRKYFLDILSEITLLECELLSVLFSEDRIAKVGEITKPGISQYNIVGSVGRLKTYGFLEVGQGTFTLGGPNLTNALNEVVKISDFGKEFVTFCLS